MGRSSIKNFNGPDHDVRYLYKVSSGSDEEFIVSTYNTVDLVIEQMIDKKSVTPERIRSIERVGEVFPIDECE